MNPPSPLGLRRLMARTAGLRLGDWSDRPVTALATDSRRVGPGAVFFALPGSHGHGLDHVADALARGAVAVVAPLPVAVPPQTALLVHPEPESLLAPLAARLYRYPARGLILAGVTGTNGKTTTTLMVSRVLALRGAPVAHWTTTEVAAGRRRFRPFWTTPPAPDLHRFLRAARQEGCAVAALEVSSHAVALGRIQGLRFAAAAVTNLSPDHLDFHGDYPRYVAAKRALVEGLGRRATCLLNADDPEVAAFASAARCRVLTYGAAAGAHLRLDRVVAGPGRCAAILEIAPELALGGTRRVSLALALTGRHNLWNAAAALGIGATLGVAPEEGAQALAALPPPPRRLETRRVGPFTVVNDVAMNEGSFEAVFAAVAEVHRGPLTVVAALRGQRGVEVHRAMAEVMARWDRRLHFAPVLISLSRPEVAAYGVDLQVRPEELSAFREACRKEGLSVRLFDALEEAVSEAAARLPEGGLLLLLGTFGMDQGPVLAEAALARRIGQDPPADAPRYLDPSLADEPD